MLQESPHQRNIIVSLDATPLLFETLYDLIKMGFSLVEVNSCETTILKKILHDFPSLRVGVSNIISTQQLEEAYTIGADFASSPGFLPSIAQMANIYAMNYFPGVATFSEAMQVFSLGYYQVRPYHPADFKFCELLTEHLPQLRLFPVEMDLEHLDNVHRYFNLPSVNTVTIRNPDTVLLKNLRTLFL